MTRHIYKPQDAFHLFDLLFRNQAAESLVYCIGRGMIFAVFFNSF